MSLRRWCRRAASASLLALAAAAPAYAASASAGQAALPGRDAGAAELARARDAVLPYVVSILVVREDFVGGEPRLSVSSGSGTVVTADGHVVTNAHVTANGKSFRVVFGDGRERDAVRVGEDPASDVAVLQVQGEPLPMAHARFAKNVDLQPGQTVLAMGAPWGLSNSLSAGVVNNPRRLLVSLFEDEADYEDKLDEDAPTGLYYAWIQHDASIAPGNSGGPLVDLDGDIVGVNTRGMLFGGDLAFAIPADDVSAVAADLIAHGEVRRSTLGLRLRSLRGTGDIRGVLVNAVERDGPAAKAGLRPGDRLLSVDGRALDALSAVDVPVIQRRFAELPADAAVQLGVSRDGSQRDVRIVPERVGPERGAAAAFAPFGMALRELTPSMAERRRLDERSGLLVESVRAGGPAATARPPLSQGALLLRADGKPLDSLDDLAAFADRPNGSKPVVLDYLANGERRVSALVPARGDRTRDPLPELPKAWVGAEVQPVPSSLAQSLGLPVAGFRITRLYPGSNLAEAGAKVGDLLTQADGEPLPAVNDSRAELFEQRVREFAIGGRVTFSGYRGGQPKEWTARLGAAPLPASALRSMDVSLLRAQMRELGFFDRVARDLPLSQQGVLIESVETGGAAGLAHLQAGDVLVTVDGTAVAGLDAVRPALATALKGDERIAIGVIRGAETRIVHIERRWIPEPP